MPEENSDPNNPTPPTGQDPKPPVSEDSQFDISKLSDTDFDKFFEDPRAYKHPRFKELSDAKKERDSLKAEQEKKKEEELKNQNKWKELAEEKDRKINEINEKLTNTTINSAIKDAAVKAGAVDLEAVTKLIDKSTISVDENGNVTGAEEAVKALLEQKAYLKGENGSPSLGNPSNPNADSNTKRFKKSQIRDPKFYQDNETDILAAIAAGNVENDMAQ